MFLLQCTKLTPFRDINSSANMTMTYAKVSVNCRKYCFTASHRMHPCACLVKLVLYYIEKFGEILFTLIVRVLKVHT